MPSSSFNEGFDRTLAGVRREVLIALSHFFSLVPHVLIDNALIYLLCCQIRSIRMTKDVEAAND